MFTELDQLHDPDTGKRKLAEVLDQVRGGRGVSYPALPWLQTNRSGQPTLLFDLNAIEQRMLKLANISLRSDVMPLLAVKSSEEPEFLSLANRHLAGFDVSNKAEYGALPDNLTDKLVTVTGPILESGLDSFTTKGNAALVTLDSQVQLDQYFSESPSVGYMLRVQGSALLEGYDPPDSAYYPATRFGFSIAEIRELLGNPRLRDNPPAGFHVHHGSEKNQAMTYRRIIEGLGRLTELLPHPARYINLGGGWHATHDEEIEDVLLQARKRFPLPCKIIMEPGRWYAGNAGFATGVIVNLTRNGDMYKCTLDLSGKCHLHWSGAKLLQDVKPEYNKANLVQFFGPTCYESDYIGQFLVPFTGDFSRDTGIAPGKQVIFSNISTYSAAWNSSFNGIPEADVVWWRSA